MDHAHNVVQRALINRQPGISMFQKNLRDLFKGHLLINCDQIHPRRKNIPGIQVIKLNRRTDQLPIFLIDAALTLRLVYNGL